MCPSRLPSTPGSMHVTVTPPGPAAEARRAEPVPLDRAFLLATLDLRQALQTLSAALVPRFASWCFVDLVGEDGVPRRVEVAHGDPAQAPLADRLRALELGGGWSTPSIQAMRDRAPRLLGALSPELLAWATQDAHHRQLLVDIGANSLLAVPLVARDRVVGAVTAIRSGPAPALGADDLRFLEAVAVPAALALDNAARYEAALRAAKR